MDTESLRFRAQSSRVPSPTFSRATRASDIGLDDVVVLTRSDLKASLATYEQLLRCSKMYRNAVLNMSTAASQYASALEDCSRVKGASSVSSEELLGASGLHYMIANSGQVLSDTLYKAMEIPLLETYDSYKGTTSSRYYEYEQTVQRITADIRKTEAANFKAGKSKQRDLAQFRHALEELRSQVDLVEQCKHDYYVQVQDSERDLWSTVSSKVSHTVRCTLDLSSRISSKSSDQIIASIVSGHPDPFDTCRPATADDDPMPMLLSSVLPSSSSSIIGAAHPTTQTRPGLRQAPTPLIPSFASSSKSSNTSHGSSGTLPWSKSINMGAETGSHASQFSDASKEGTSSSSRASVNIPTSTSPTAADSTADHHTDPWRGSFSEGASATPTIGASRSANVSQSISPLEQTSHQPLLINTSRAQSLDLSQEIPANQTPLFASDAPLFDDSDHIKNSFDPDPMAGDWSTLSPSAHGFTAPP